MVINGEILIAGDSVSAGYVNKKSDKFIKYNGEDAYLTGDIGYIKNNILWICGRKDNQIKYRGYRIELDDITRNVYKLDYVDKAVTIPQFNNNKVINIVMFLKLKPKLSKNITETQIKKELKDILPNYMCPRIKLVDEFKLTLHDKVDIKELEKILDDR